MRIFNGTTYTRTILLYSKKLHRPICTDMDDVHEFHYILRDWQIYKIAYGERRSPDGIYSGYLDLFTPNTELSPEKINIELPLDTRMQLRHNLELEIIQHTARVNRLASLLKKIK